MLVTSVYAKVAATNVVGDSIYSEVGNGAEIAISFMPDAPVNLTRDEENTSLTVLSFTWQDGASNGGQLILDYRVQFDQGRDEWRELQANVLTQSLTVSGATPGTSYKFKVEARNVIGYSPES